MKAIYVPLVNRRCCHHVTIIPCSQDPSLELYSRDTCIKPYEPNYIMNPIKLIYKNNFGTFNLFNKQKLINYT